MKAIKGVEDLAAQLTSAARAPLVSPAERSISPAERGSEKRARADTLQLTLRPARTLYERYVAIAAARIQARGLTVTVQEVMLETLEEAQT
ncbi:hypothetical protein [Robbsia andropogonis]|uniref:hypothetical protein n=1 Tax=Robbsia andropogonis TaxID=28092 RepID=UPI002A6AFE6D|nr:hypothetical protein [Robbsia andropogonis]